jgi:hypothetical protein
MNRYGIAVLVIGTGELIATLIFYILNKNIGLSESAEASSFRWGPVFKGILERVTIVVGLLAEFTTILAAFGALKIGTRLSEDKENQISNTYFLVGNLLSLLFAMTYVSIIQTLD